MAPFKFEEDIKSVLEKRTIEPSKRAWEELEFSLNGTKGNVKKRSFLWIGIAASVVGILWISISFFKTEKVMVEPTIVEIPIENIEPSIKANTDLKEEKIIKAETTFDDSIVSRNTELIAIENQPKTIKKETISEIKKGQNDEIENEILISKVNVVISENISEEEKQLQEIAAQIAALEKENATNAEIDLLLKNAQQNISNQKINESGMSVSTYALLFEVEEELDPTFKEKVFKILSENYSSVKNAVAQRND